VRELFAERVELTTLERDHLQVTAFPTPADFAQHFIDKYGPTIAALKNARANGQEDELRAALQRFMAEQDRGGRFEQEYLVVVGKRK